MIPDAGDHDTVPYSRAPIRQRRDSPFELVAWRRRGARRVIELTRAPLSDMVMMFLSHFPENVRSVA
jgi:hypothetical protein